MALEDRTLGHTPALNVEMVTVATTSERGNGGYDILIQNGPIEGFYVNKDRKDFVFGLKRHDKLIIVRRGEGVLAAYGPIEENKLYAPEPKRIL